MSIGRTIGVNKKVRNRPFLILGILYEVTNLNFGFLQPGPLADKLSPDFGVQGGRQRARRRRGRRGEGRHRHRPDAVLTVTEGENQRKQAR